MAFWYANPSIYFLLLIQVRLAGGTLLVIIGKEMRYILGRLPVWCTFTPMANLESPTNLTTMFLQYGGKNHREPIQIRRECADLTKKGPSLDLKTTVWRHGVNCITMSPYINPIGKFVTNHCCKKKQKNNLPDNKVLARFKSDWNSFINYDEKICKRSLLLIIWLMRLIIIKIITVPKHGSLFSPLIATFFPFCQYPLLRGWRFTQHPHHWWYHTNPSVRLQFQLRSLMTTRYLNSSTWGKSSSPLQSGHSTFFWLRDLERLILIAITSYSTGNHRSDRGKLPSGKAKKQRWSSRHHSGDPLSLGYM